MNAFSKCLEELVGLRFKDFVQDRDFASAAFEH